MPSAFLHPFARPTRDDFVTIVSGQGARIVDDTGRSYLDAVGGLWFCQVGYGRSSIGAAMARQAERLGAFHCFEPFTNDKAETLAETLRAWAPFPDGRVFFTSSGSEAVDTALKLARHVHVLEGRPERTVIVRREHAYHGVNFGGTTAQGMAPNRAGWGPLVPDFVEIPADDEGALAAVFEARGGDIAALISEPLQGAGGVRPVDTRYLRRTRELCDAHGALLIHDEVITGFGRLGARFASERYGVTPDLITFAKGVTSGYAPLGGVIIGARARAALEADAEHVLRHGYTYSGHPIACAAALENLAIIEGEGLIERANTLGAQLEEGLRSLVDRGQLAGVRGDGAVWGALLPEGRDASELRYAMMKRGVIPRPLGPSVLAFCPPLVTTDDEAEEMIGALAAVLD